MHKSTLIRAAPVALALLLGSAFVGYAHADPPKAPDQKKPAKKILEQHFCCAETYNKDGKKSGTDCSTIDDKDVSVCRLGGGAVLFCPGAWDLNTSGTATC